MRIVSVPGEKKKAIPPLPLDIIQQRITTKRDTCQDLVNDLCEYLLNVNKAIKANKFDEVKKILYHCETTLACAKTNAQDVINAEIMLAHRKRTDESKT